MKQGVGTGPTYPLDLLGVGPLTSWESLVADENEFLGAAETSAGGDRVRLWFGSAVARRRAAARLGVLAASRTAVESPGCVTPQQGVTFQYAAPEPAHDWTAPYREFFSGVRAGGFFIHPPHIPAPAGLQTLLLTPGAAFGTGVHPTTRMVLESLEEHLRTRGPRVRVLDIGTGSGILAVAAALLGARQIVGLDLDEVAVHCAEEAAAANRLPGRIRFRAGDYRDPAIAAELHALAPGGFDVILANLSAGLLTDFWDHAASRLRPRGRIVISGFLRSQAHQVLCAFPGERVRIAEIRLERPDVPESDTWVAAALEHRATCRAAPRQAPPAAADPC